MVQRQIGACFEIRVDGKTRSYRDPKEIAIEAGEYLKQMQPKSEIIVRDVRDNSVTLIEEGSGFGFGSGKQTVKAMTAGRGHPLCFVGFVGGRMEG
jgi:hypothetical protein